MRNLILHQVHIQNLFKDTNCFPLAYHIDEFSKVITVLDSEFKLLLFTYEHADIFSNFHVKKTLELEALLGVTEDGMDILSELMSATEGKNSSQANYINFQNSPVKFFIYKNEEDSVHMLLQSGKYINVNLESEKAKIESLTTAKVLCAEVSPNLENIVIICSNFSILLLNYEFELINSCNLDDGDNSDITKDNNECPEASVSWRGDSQYFCTLYAVNGGRKCLVRDNKLVIFKSPARADNKVVFSVGEGPVKNLENLVAWQPSGSLISYFQQNTIPADNKVVNDASMKAGVLFSEKNCLRHGEFWVDNLSNPDEIRRVNAKILRWNMDLPLIMVHLQVTDSLSQVRNYVNLYHRSNYEWSLKYSFELGKGKRLFNCKFSDALSLRLFLFYTDSNFQCIDFKFDYQNALSNCNLPQENGSVAVISGNKIKLTPLGQVNIPPPMALHTITLDTRSSPFILNWWRKYLFILSNDKIDIIQANTSDRSYTLLDELNIDHSLCPSALTKSFLFTVNDSFTRGYFIILKVIPNDDRHDQLAVLTFDVNFDSETDDLKFNGNTAIKVDQKKIGRCAGLFPSLKSDKNYDEKYFKMGGVLGMISGSNKNSQSDTVKKEEDENDLFFGLTQGMEKSKLKTQEEKYFYSITIEGKERIFNKIYLGGIDDQIEVRKEATQVSSNFDILKAHSIITYNNEEKIVYFTKNHRLFLNNILLALDVTSFDFFKHFLLFTQSSNSPYNTLHIIDVSKEHFLPPISNILDPLFTPDFNYKSFSIRTIERSALIVTVSKVNLVLQMGRGNLETIYPRLLVLNLLTELICINRDYLQAFELVRKHKINTNFIYDVDPEGFSANVPLFISQVQKADYINLFLNSLENVISEELLQLDPELNSKEDFKKLYIYNKVNRICDEMRKELSKENVNANNKFLTSILHTHTKKNPPEYLEALKLVQELKIREKNSLGVEELISSRGGLTQTTKSSGPSKHGTFTADKALEYLCWVVNADVLFDFSLKTYDFELVIMVAKHTQKDPKEYLPYLKKLQDLQADDPILMKYQVNMDLKSYSDALKEVSAGGFKYFEKCLDLIKKYELYEQAINLFSVESGVNDKLLRTVYQVYGDYLKHEKKNNLEAAWAYYRSGLAAEINFETLELALKCFFEAGNVNEVIELLRILNTSQNYSNKFNILSLLSEMIDTCTAAKKVSELEKIHLYLSDNQIQFRQDNRNGDRITELQCKLMDGLVRTKRWKLAFLFSTQTEVRVVKEFEEGVSLSANLQINELRKNINLFEEKFNRLLKVQHLKRTQPHLFAIELKDKMLEDNVSDTGSVISNRSGSSSKSKKTSLSKMSKTSKMSKKSKQKISKRNIKEGSPLEEDYLIAVLTELKMADTDVESLKELIKVLNFIKKTTVAEELKSLLDEYLGNVNPTCANLLSVAQQDFINSYPEIRELFPSVDFDTHKMSQGLQTGFKMFKTVSG